jgi:hypothetical protein
LYSGDLDCHLGTQPQGPQTRLTIAEIIAFAWSLKGKFPAGQDPDALIVEKDITERGDDY